MIPTFSEPGLDVHFQPARAHIDGKVTAYSVYRIGVDHQIFSCVLCITPILLSIF